MFGAIRRLFADKGKDNPPPAITTVRIVTDNPLRARPLFPNFATAQEAFKAPFLTYPVRVGQCYYAEKTLNGYKLLAPVFHIDIKQGKACLMCGSEKINEMPIKVAAALGLLTVEEENNRQIRVVRTKMGAVISLS
jgi:hypothetical protein